MAKTATVDVQSNIVNKRVSWDVYMSEIEQCSNLAITQSVKKYVSEHISSKEILDKSYCSFK